MRDDDLKAAVQDIVGQRCERAANPYGSILSLDFGPLARRKDDSPNANEHGWRHLTVLSPWRLETADEVISDWNVNGGSNGQIIESLRLLTGYRVTSAITSGPAWDLRVTWENGLTLVVFADCTDDRDDAWFILGTDGLEVSATPALKPLDQPTP